MRQIIIIIILITISVNCESQSRWWFPNATYTSDITAPAHASDIYSNTTQYVVRPIQDIWQLNGYSTYGPITVGATDFGVLALQYVSHSLAAQTITGCTFKAQFRAFVSSTTSSDISLQIAVVIVNPAGVYKSQISSGGTSISLSTTSTNRTCTGSLSTFSVNTGDRLVIEISFTRNSGSVSRTASVVTGGGNATDLPEDNTTTASGNKPWIEFSQTIKLNNGIF